MNQFEKNDDIRPYRNLRGKIGTYIVGEIDFWSQYQYIFQAAFFLIVIFF